MTVLDDLVWLAETPPSPLLPFTLLLALTVLYYIYTSSVHPLRNYPGPFWAKISDLPIVLSCRRVRHSAWVAEQHKKYGHIIRIAPNHLSIDSPEAVSQIYGHKTGFIKGPFYEDKYRIQVLFNTRDVSIHQRKRKFINPAFSTRELKEFEKYMSSSLQLLVAHLLKVAENGNGCSSDFSRWSNFLAFDIIGDYAFGSPFGFLATGIDDANLIETVDARGEVLNALGHVPLWLRPAMKYFIFDSFWYEGLNRVSSFASIALDALEKREANPSPRKDLMSFLLNAKDVTTGGSLPRKEIAAEAISFLVGGSDTTSSTMTHFMDFVSRDQKLQDELYGELMDAFPDSIVENGYWVAEEEVAGKLPLLNAILKETMRMRPTSSTGLQRLVPESGKSVHGNFIPGKTLVSIPTTSILHNPYIFKDPTCFNSQRWLGEDAGGLMEFFIPFSVGPRACVGRNFAWMEMTKTLSTIFRLFEFTRAIERPSTLREGFFVKITECNVFVKRRAQRKDLGK